MILWRTYGSALNFPPLIRVKKCMFVALSGSENRDLNWGAAGAICEVRVEFGLSAAFVQRLAKVA